MMNTLYGKFEAVAELHKTASGAVWSARSQASRETASACIKMVQLNEAMLEDRDTSVAESLLVSAAIQQTMANKSEFWAPVHELGSDGTNAFYVSRLYPRTLQTLIQNETRLSSAELKTIMMGIVDGLMDLETAYHRQHGNLKPSNVMIAAKGHISPGGVLLTDPDAIAEQMPSMNRAPDTKALGQILYALVTHKPYTGARLPLPKSPAWNQLGSSGREWFTMCQRLLDTFSRQGLPTLEAVRMHIGEIQETRRPIPRSVYVALLLAAAGTAGYQYRDQLAVELDHSRDTVATFIKKFQTNSTMSGPVAVVSDTKTTAMSPVQSRITPANWAAAHAVHPAPADPLTTRPVVQTQPTVPKEDSLVAMIREAESPDMHSALATQEFNHRRDQWLSRRTRGSVNIAEWNTVYHAVESLDGDYPQPDPTTAWPEQLATELIGRRDVELARAVDAVFNHDNADPSGYTTELTDVARTAAASSAAHNALASADLVAADAAVKDFNLKLDALETVDADAAAAFGPARQDFGRFIDARTATDRASLLIAVGNDSLPLSVRLRSWLRLSKAGGSAWPADLATLAADRSQGDRLFQMSKDVPTTQAMIAAEQQSRFDGFFSSLRDIDTVRAAATQAATAQLVSLVPLYPDWFQYDVTLARLSASPAPDLSPEQTKTFLDLADKVNAPNAAQLRSAFTIAAEPPRTLATAGPAGVAGWKLAPGSTVDHRTYLLGNESIEFIRVHQTGSNGSPAASCYLSTTEVPVSLLMAVLDQSHAAQLHAAQMLNAHPASATPTMQVWSFTPDGIQLDKQDYRSCFLLTPTVHLPAQAITPELAMYVARLVGCRLPTSDEWRGALMQATQPTADGYQWAFAMRNWKLRDADFATVMNRARNSRPPQYWPTENIFRDPAVPNPPAAADDTRIWSSMNLATLAGQIAPVPNTNQPDPDQALPMAAGQLGFREVDDGAHYTGVFHDLIGNAAEWVLDVPPSDSDKLDAADPATAVDKIKNWFTPDRQAHIGAIGGSALSPPDLDPRTACRLLVDAPTRAFSDVGFRLAFSDPKAASAVNPAKLRAVALQHADYVTAEAKNRTAD